MRAMPHPLHPLYVYLNLILATVSGESAAGKTLTVFKTPSICKIKDRDSAWLASGMAFGFLVAVDKAHNYIEKTKRALGTKVKEHIPDGTMQR